MQASVWLRCIVRWRWGCKDYILNGVLDIVPVLGKLLYELPCRYTCFLISEFPYYVLFRSLFREALSLLPRCHFYLVATLWVRKCEVAFTLYFEYQYPVSFLFTFFSSSSLALVLAGSYFGCSFLMNSIIFFHFLQFCVVLSTLVRIFKEKMILLRSSCTQFLFLSLNRELSLTSESLLTVEWWHVSI